MLPGQLSPMDDYKHRSHITIKITDNN